ncbi:hypothetical protein M8C21_001788 [Ambrosia artemisiifolia]|uniref:Protein kinase domain-containing protein n=1 Tax=Ambrosia artemisiifolia TaxID=4212 RepID=A0AAD5CLJ1_AMBAR|nr:hypothetical protein M8C21_001788 [Ambrosia artemisiifolia]
MLSGDRRSFRDYPDDVGPSRSEGTSTPEHRRNRRSISITPEIGDDIVRAVRAMNETLKQNRLLRDQVESRLQNADVKKDESEHEHDGTPLYSLKREHMSSQKAMSLPTSPHQFRSPKASDDISDVMVRDEAASTWSKILDSPMFQNKPLLPYQEWNIDFSELTVGTRVGIGFFGEVFRGIWNGTEVAIKVFLEQDLTAENMEDFCNEISILSRLRHPNAAAAVLGGGGGQQAVQSCRRLPVAANL